MNPEVNDIVKTGRDSIIQTALKIIDKDISVDEYQVKVMASNTDIYTTFTMPIKFSPLNSKYYYGVYVNLIDKMTSKNMISNPKDFESDADISFFKNTEESLSQILFVIKGINNYDAIGSIDDIKGFEDDMTIIEFDAYYDVIVLSDFQESWYKVEKSTGRVYDEGHAHLILDEDNESEKEDYTEIK